METTITHCLKEDCIWYDEIENYCPWQKKSALLKSDHCDLITEKKNMPYLSQPLIYDEIIE